MANQVRRFILRGEVQGCGLRPAMARLANEHNWTGSVRNTAEGVELILHGCFPEDVDLKNIILNRITGRAIIEKHAHRAIEVDVSRSFEILDSFVDGPMATPLPLDTGICSACLQETRDPKNRRSLYPFTTCAECGPRYSILISMPFDRERTTMNSFERCSECEREYRDSSDRRFHAQTISCPDCGPRLWAIRAGDGEKLSEVAAIVAAADALLRGEIVAVRGIGGYQLLVDATSLEAVARLRQRKKRPAKPLAVLCRSIADAKSLADISSEDQALICSPVNPIVLVRQRPSTKICGYINPGLADIGLMLPTTALHDILLERVGVPLVCTSGNVDGEPLAYRVDEAEARLKDVADLFVHHNREIERPIDDSVVRVISSQPVCIRAARGIAPMSLTGMFSALRSQSITACGGHQKSAVAMTNGSQMILAPHIGDCDTLESQDRWVDQVQGLRDILMGGFGSDSPTIIACDAHPNYFPTQWSLKQSQSPHVVWHHHAHVVSGMLEHGWLDREVLGVAWDGTGLGPDGTIWGGEFLRATVIGFERVAHLRPFQLPGGESATRDLRRLGVAVLSQLDEISAGETSQILGIDEKVVRLHQQAMTSSFAPTTTSCGRLFDVAALLILNHARAEFEGHAAMCLEAACDTSSADSYRVEIQTQAREPVQLDWRPVIRCILEDRRNQIPPRVMAMRFHRGLAQAIIDIVRRYPRLPTVLCGGAFQNKVLVELITELWPQNSPPLGRAGMIPPNDGGLAAGQLAVAMESSECRETCAQIGNRQR